MNGGSGLERRRLLGALVTGAGIAVGGCLDGTQPDDGNGGDDGGRFEPTIEQAAEIPFEFTDSQRCAVCGMPATKYPEPGQFRHENGQAATVDSPGCLFAYIVASTSDSPMDGAWTTDRATGDLIDATAAHFVLVTDEEAADDPMGIDPRAFADREDALTHLEEWDAEELSAEDDIIVGLEAVDLELASIYRPHHVSDE